jgi:hypothetical protein
MKSTEAVMHVHIIAYNMARGDRLVSFPPPEPVELPVLFGHRRNLLQEVEGSFPQNKQAMGILSGSYRGER